MNAKLVTSKMTERTLRLARMVAGATGERQYEVLERAMLAEAGRAGVREPAAAREGPNSKRSGAKG